MKFYLTRSSEQDKETLIEIDTLEDLIEFIKQNDNDDGIIIYQAFMKRHTEADFIIEVYDTWRE